MGDTVKKDGDQTILEVEDLHISFGTYLGMVRAVNGVSFRVKKGEVLGVVGESGCGKSVTALSILKLIPTPPGRIDRGTIHLRVGGRMVDITKLPPHGREIRRIRGKEVAMIFQEPMRSLHPMFTVGGQIVEGLLEHNRMSKKGALDRAVDLLNRVGLPKPREAATYYPHQLSGGMRQRAMIAIALACEPELLIADEPTTALDVTIQAQILELIKELQEDSGMSVILITHNMGVVAETAQSVMVMYLGWAVEQASVGELFENPLHPYTQGLLESIPTLVSVSKTPLKSLSGVVPELYEVPQGCVFADRCPRLFEKCSQVPPAFEARPGHYVKCWLYDGGRTDTPQ